MQEWRVYSKKADFQALGDRFGIDPVVARIIRNRDVIGDDAVDSTHVNHQCDESHHK